MGGGGLRYGDLGATARHLCVDMQRLFAEDTAWKTPWMDRVLPQVRRIVSRFPERTIFTRFIPVRHAGQGRGTWRRYYRCWPMMTIDALGIEMVDLVPELHRFTPPAQILDKRAYSPWYETDLEARLRSEGVDTLIVSGGETDVCVLSAVLGAVDRGYRVVVATDALCSSTDETHDASIKVYESRYGQQVEAVTTDDILDRWN
ncbi:cysteine hydrolase family protein [Labrys monachus]|uniref:Nicotinamidase-related amidase n=1 Tax=Labrys monachus TaxID=217067 RepID=A0ABU0FDW7_9HYPH|nr:isochorismatase family cysteine hydrolase [Labrys monachus]MDQ0392802.1 nicotinamidase-related amidase [Labrys monachus]